MVAVYLIHCHEMDCGENARAAGYSIAKLGSGSLGPAAHAGELGRAPRLPHSQSLKHVSLRAWRTDYRTYSTAQKSVNQHSSIRDENAADPRG